MKNAGGDGRAVRRDGKADFTLEPPDQNRLVRQQGIEKSNMPIEEIKPLKESDLYSIFNSLASLFELQQKKAEDIVKQAGSTQVELACYMQGVADQAKTAAWTMRKQSSRSQVATNDQYIFRLGGALISYLDSMHAIIDGMPVLEIWNKDDS